MKGSYIVSVSQLHQADANYMLIKVEAIIFIQMCREDMHVSNVLEIKTV